MMPILRPPSGLRWGRRLPVSSLRAAAEEREAGGVAARWHGPAAVGSGVCRGDDAFTGFGGRIERNSLLEQREEAPQRREGRKRRGNPTASWCDAFPVELEVGLRGSRCRELCAGGGGL